MELTLALGLADPDPKKGRISGNFRFGSGYPKKSNYPPTLLGMAVSYLNRFQLIWSSSTVPKSHRYSGAQGNIFIKRDNKFHF